MDTPERPSVTEQSGNASACPVCGKPLGPRSTRFCGRTCADKARSVQAHVMLRCANAECPRPDELLPRRKNKLGQPGRQRAYHPECRPLGGVQRKTGREAFCERCGESLGYRPASWFAHGHRYCETCGGASKRGRRPTTFVEERPCAQCSTPVQRTASEARAKPAEEWFCSRPCYFEWRTTHRRAAPITCEGCGRESRAPNRRRFATYDPETATYVCELCQHPRGERHPCDREGCDQEVVSWRSRPRRYCSTECAALARRKTPKRVPCRNPDCRRNHDKPVVMELMPYPAARRRFCSKACAAQWFSRYRKPVTCQGCATTFRVPKSELDRYRFCTPECRRRHEASHPATRPQSRASEERVLAAWHSGVRGPARLAKAANASLRVVYRTRDRHGIELSDSRPTRDQEREAV